MLDKLNIIELWKLDFILCFEWEKCPINLKSSQLLTHMWSSGVEAVHLTQKATLFFDLQTNRFNLLVLHTENIIMTREVYHHNTFLVTVNQAMSESESE